MEQRLTDVQLKEIVAEVQQLSLRRESELDAEQVREILRELNLPPEFLEEAMTQLHRREALAAQQRRNRWLIGGALAAVALVMIVVAIFTQQQQQSLSRVTVQRDRITLAQDDGSSLKDIPRASNRELFYRFTLSDAPVGQRLSLSCQWSDPSGQIVYQNRYQTKTVDTPTWNSVCRYTINSSAAVGTWTVKAFLGDRQLSSANFDVK